MPGLRGAQRLWGGGVVTGLVVDGTGFEVLDGDERIGSRRVIGPVDVALLTGLAGRYVRAVHTRAEDSVFVALGRELYAWLDGGQGQLTALLEKASRPLVFDVEGPRSPPDGRGRCCGPRSSCWPGRAAGCWLRMGWLVVVWCGAWARPATGRGRMS